MNDTHVAGVDLNLLVALDALLVERNVTRAAARVGVTQSAMSHALARLRAQFDDPLFVRGPTGMVPTPRAEALAGPVERVMADIRGVLAPPRFDPATARGVVRLGTTDYGAFVLVPRIVAALQAEAPGLDLHVLGATGDGADDLAGGAVDLLVARPQAPESAPAGLHEQHLFGDEFVVVMRAGHPAAGAFDVEAWLAHPHVLVAPRGRSGGIVDGMLAERGLARRVAVLLPHFLVAPHIVAASDATVTLAARVARRLAEPLGLVLRPPPIALPGFTMVLAWHERTHGDPGYVWLRRRIVELSREV